MVSHSQRDQGQYRWSANRDLQSIKSYFDDISPATTDNVYSDIVEAINVLRSFPLAGYKVPNRKERRLITRKYGYVISYLPAKKHIEIVGVFRFQNRDV